MKIKEIITLKETPFLSLVEVKYSLGKQVRSWFGVTRTTATHAVVIAALTEKNELIFVRQPRPMVRGYTLELPAGLADIEGETPKMVAERELLEETGYEAKDFQVLIGGTRGHTISSGLTDERLILVVAKDAKKITEPLENEATEPILVPLSRAYNWAMQMSEDGEEIDYKVFGTIRILEREVGSWISRHTP